MRDWAELDTSTRTLHNNCEKVYQNYQKDKVNTLLKSKSVNVNAIESVQKAIRALPKERDRYAAEYRKLLADEEKSSCYIL